MDIPTTTKAADAVLYLPPEKLQKVIQFLRGAEMGYDIDEKDTRSITIAGSKCVVIPETTAVFCYSISDPLPPSVKRKKVLTEPFVYDVYNDPDGYLNNYQGIIAPENTGDPYPCRYCGKLNAVKDKAQWYVVERGFATGIFHTLALAEPAVRLPGAKENYPNTLMRAFRTYTDAEKWLIRARARGEIVPMDLNVAMRKSGLDRK